MKKREPKDKKYKYRFYVIYKFYLDSPEDNICGANGNGSSIISSKHKHLNGDDLEEIQGILKEQCADSGIQVETIIIMNWRRLYH